MPQSIINKLSSEPEFGIRVSYYLLLSLFFADSVVHAFVNIPVLVPGGIVVLCFQAALIIKFRFYDRFLIIASSAFILLTLINNAIHDFHPSNVSDLFFILLFFSSFQLYYRCPGALNLNMVIALFVTSVILIIPGFFGVNDWQSVIYHDSTGFEYTRVHHHGLFRVPHYGAYFFGFIAVFYTSMFFRKRKIISLVIAITAIALCVYTGVRIFVVAFFLAGLLYLMIRAKWKVILALAIVLLSLVMYSDELLELSKGTFLLQYIWLVDTAIDHITVFPRAVIWSSWLTEMESFNAVDYLTGKTFFGSILANRRNITEPIGDIWFHNDFLNILFSYGIAGLLIYTAFIVRVTIKLKKILTQSFFAYLYFVTMILLALFNGLYFYYPVFILVPLFLMGNIHVISFFEVPGGCVLTGFVPAPRQDNSPHGNEKI